MYQPNAYNGNRQPFFSSFLSSGIKLLVSTKLQNIKLYLIITCKIIVVYVSEDKVEYT